VFTFEQFYLTCLSHASYLIGSEGIAAVVDPQRDVEIYLSTAAEQGLEIRYVIETHLHADFVSGHHELANRTGAKVYLGAQAGAKFDHVPVRDGDEVRFGNCVLRFVETPGHTLESICILVTDLDRSPDPFAVLTGDTLFIGDVGRPDLAADHTPQQLAGMLYHSVHDKLLKLPDDVEVYPAHGAGSLCGRSMSAERKSTIGLQRATNYALRARSEDEFVHLVTADLPERPRYFSKDVELNREGAPALADLPPIPLIPATAAYQQQSSGAVILDTRPAPQFSAGHAAGSIQIGLSGQFASWAAIVIGLETDVILLAEDEQTASEARLRLARVGIERVIGAVAGGISGWVEANLPVATLNQIGAEEVRAGQLDGIQLLDVRRAPEWQAGRIPGAIHKPLDSLSRSLNGLDPAQRTFVHCKGGYRSTIACSILQRAGFQDVYNLTGGYDAWGTLPACSAAAS
jgi:glyoxylase-like metal-dependent hydrolase (beta-lactamase superfamily II)/rhodanese-related sulfurtransferase